MLHQLAHVEGGQDFLLTFLFDSIFQHGQTIGAGCCHERCLRLDSLKGAEMVADLLSQGTLKLTKPIHKVVTYHDSFPDDLAQKDEEGSPKDEKMHGARRCLLVHLGVNRVTKRDLRRD